MRAVIINEHGGPEVLKIADRPTPTPGDYDLLVEVHASSINPVDTLVRMRGLAPRPMPMILGYDASGVVTKVGSKVTGFKPGDQVYGCPNLFGDGAQAEFCLLDSRAAAHKPKSIDHVTAACLPLVSLTAWEALHDKARIEKDQTVLIQGGAGGVGHIAVQLARLHGCKVFTTASRPESISFCTSELKAHEVIDYSKTDVAKRVNELTHNKGVNVVFDTVGGNVFQQSLGCIMPFGSIVAISSSTPGDQLGSVFTRSISIHYEFMGARQIYGANPERQGEILTDIARLVDNGSLKPHVSQRFPIERITDAHKAIESKHTIGKIAVAIR
jgi:NADPH:quinone reductase